jgi:tRNA A-37 threonylcarbamoyl transferase component Bud32
MSAPDRYQSGGVLEDSPTASFGRGTPAPEPPARRFLPGMRFGDRYRIIEMLGRGATGEVYRADDLKLGQPVALKFLPPHLAEDADARARIRNEVRVARQVSHPNVCRVYDIAEADGYAFISMEYVDGEDLRSVLRRLGRPSREKASEIARQLCAGLAAAHEIGVLHRDLKSENIMIDGRGRARITDFGLASFQHELPERALAGTPVYMAPELFAGAQASTRTDIYSLGAVLYELFTGRSPFGPATVEELRRQKATALPPSPREHAPDIDPVLEGLILSCLEADPSQRPASALAIAALLPGGDPVALALASGDTPSPEAVAAAGGEERVSRQVAFGSLFVLAAGLAAITALNSRASLTGISPPAKPPIVLADRARELLARLGYREPAVDRAYGYGVYGTYLEHIAETDSSPGRWAALQARKPRPYAFWYRESPVALIPLHAYGEVRFGDPPRSIAGMAGVVTDDEGRLQILEIVPPQRDASPANAAVPDYSPLFEVAGLNMTDFAPAPAEWNPLLSSESRSAWTGHYPGQDEVVRVEAAAYRGRPTYFQVLETFDRPTREVRNEPKPASKVASEWANVVLMLAVLLVPPFVARRNLRRGVGDRRGAWRLGLAVFLLQLAAWALRTETLRSLFKSETLLVVQLGVALVLAAAAALIYLALEPYVRRLWPRSLISWTRLLMGRFGDPRVGRDVLIGAVAGVGVILIQRLEWLVPSALGVAPRIPYSVSDATLLGGGKALALAVAPVFLFGPLVVLFVLTIPMLLLRRRALAIAAAMAILILGDAHWVARGSSGIALASALVGVVLVYAVLVGTLIRFGLLSLGSAYFFFEILQRWPLTFDTDAWYAGTSLMGMLILAVVAAAAVVVARGGASVWRRAAVEMASRS